MYRPNKRFISLLFLLAVLSTAKTSFGQSLSEQSGSIRREVEAGNLNAAVVELRKFKAADSDAFAANNLDYLLGRLLEQKGDRGSAAKTFRDVLARRSILSQYAAWHAARIARANGDLVQERERLRQLLMSAPNSLLREAATMRLAESFSASKDHSAAIAALKPLTETLNPSISRQALKRTGDSYLLLGKKAEARDMFTRLVDTIPDAARPDDFALAAVRALDALDKEKSSAGLLETDHLQRAGIYQFNRDFDGARAHYLAIVSESPQSSNVPDALFQLGRGFYQQEKYDEAIKYLQRVQSQYDSSSAGRDALALTAGAYVRMKQLPTAIATYKEFINRYPNAPGPERAYLNLIDALRDDGRDQEALSWINQTRVRFKDQLGGTLALFSQARIHISQNNWPAALADLDELSQV
ncbi:MAG TPA: tetratricopeptide repeat protein, partial [Pyrinomonadaceae bacterium]|nr:tetratricopeptide repeat protein [Pyrinomonadaceae bacterium]